MAGAPWSHVWRLARRRYPALDGEGARRFGGRWTAPGASVVYLATHPALAVLELLVPTDPALVPHDLVLSCWALPEGVGGHRVAAASLPDAWHLAAASAACRGVGAAWLETGGLWLEVPSAVLPEASNVLLNPAHLAMASVTLVRSRPFSFDARLL